MADSFEFIQWFFLGLSTIALVIFTYYIMKYAQKFGDKQDNFTILCFICVEMTLILKICTRSFAMLGMRLKGQSVLDYVDTHDADDLFICTYNISSTYPTSLFQIAILFNSLRWIHLIMIQKNVNLHRLTQLILMFLIGVELLILIFTATFKVQQQCTSTLTQDQTVYELAILMYNVTCQIINFKIVIVYIYASVVFYKYYKGEIEIGQKKLKPEQVNAMKKNARQIFIFFIILIAIIIFRQIPYLIYEIVYIVNNNEVTDSSEIISICFYLSEIALVAILTVSIKWSLITQKQYKQLRITDSMSTDSIHISRDDYDNNGDINNDNKSNIPAYLIEDSVETQSNFLRDMESSMRRLNAFSANDDLRTIFAHESVQNDQIMKLLKLNPQNQHHISAVISTRDKTFSNRI